MKMFTLALLLFGVALTCFGQATGTVVGSVSDNSNARIPAVTVRLAETETGVERTVMTNEIGVYTFSLLQPGTYAISVESTGFKKVTKHATVNAGRDVTVEFTLEVGDVTQAIDVGAEVSTINLVDSKVDAVIAQSQIRDLPLNGRSAYEMAKLVPGVKVQNIANKNGDNQVSIAGQPFSATRYSIEGINVTEMETGGAGVNFGSDVIQEFQVSINNNDPSLGISAAGGAINLVSRSGSNAFHGGGFGFFRNNQYAAFPGLAHPTPLPNPGNDPSITAFNAEQADPVFWRRQFGGTFGGPILKNRLFGITSIDRQYGSGAASFLTGNDDLAAFNQIRTYPRERLMQTDRLDWRATDKHSFFAMFSKDSLYTRASGNSSLPATWPSFENFRDNHGYVVMTAWTAIWSPTLVSNIRVGMYREAIGRNTVPESAEEARLYAPLSGLPRLGAATVNGTNLIFGNEQATGQRSVYNQPQFVANFTNVRGKHTVRFGAAWTPLRYWKDANANDPYRATIFNPTQARQAGISIPATFTTIGDVMQLPLNTVVLPVGKQYTYPFVFQGDGYDLLWRQQVQGYVGDSYKFSPRLTLNGTLGWTYDAVAVPNYDMPRPQTILSLLGETGQPATPRIPKNRFSPSGGFAWDPKGDGKTVIRGGFGLYFPTGLAGTPAIIAERSQLAPVGSGYVSIAGTAITNPKTGSGVLNFGSAAANAAAGVYRLSDFVNHARAIRTNLENTLFTGTNRDFSVTNFDYFKASSSAIFDPNFRQSYNLQSMIGVQRQFGNDWLADATMVYNVTNQTPYISDANRLLSAGGSVLPAYGAILLSTNGGKGNYRALLLSAKKRFAQRFSVSAGYTLSSSKATIGTLVDQNVLKNNFGYVADNRRHVANVAVMVNVPWGFEVSVLSLFQSRLPFNPFVNGIDLDGDGTASDRLPGVPLNGGQFVSADELRSHAATFNQTYAGKRDVRGGLIQPINLPANFQTGDSVFTQDLRITKVFNVKENIQVKVIGEVFNVLNIANLSYATAAGNVYSTGFGQPFARQGNIFGSEGPRAFQFGARLSF